MSRSTWKQNQIRNIIISFVAINMMNLFSLFKWTINIFFHYKTMFVTIFLFTNSYSYVTFFINITTTFPSRIQSLWQTFMSFLKSSLFISRGFPITLERTVFTIFPLYDGKISRYFESFLADQTNFFHNIIISQVQPWTIARQLGLVKTRKVKA